jgi:hypothetical protein
MTHEDQHFAALLPYDPITDVCRRAIPMDGDTGKAEQQIFLRALLDLPWLAPKIRAAVMTELGLSLREQNVRIEQARTVTLRYNVAETEKRMRAAGERPPKGTVRDAAIEAEASEAGLTPEALRKRLERLPKS